VRTIGNNISIPIEPTHTNATVRPRGCPLAGSVRGAGVRRPIGAIREGTGRRGLRTGGTGARSERVKNITPSHTGAASRMKRALTNTNNGRHKRTAGRCAKNRPTHGGSGSSLLRWHYSFSRTRWPLDTAPTRRAGPGFEGNFEAVMRRAGDEAPWKKLTLEVPGLFLGALTCLHARLDFHFWCLVSSRSRRMSSGLDREKRRFLHSSFNSAF